MVMPLEGPGGEPVDFLRTLLSHGIADLPPFFVDTGTPSLTVTLSLDRSVRTVTISPAGTGRMVIDAPGPGLSGPMERQIIREVRRVLRLDEDLTEFYGMAAKDRSLSWAVKGAGRLIQSQTVFEEVVKTICTTNCAWSATVRMVSALVARLGRKTPGRDHTGRAFPTPEAVLNAGDEFFGTVARAGYRGRYITTLARMVVAGEIDLEGLALNAPKPLSDDETERRLLGLPGVGPYAAAHIMMMLGRYSRLILDSWTRPKYARLTGKAASDQEITRRFKKYGKYAGLAFWLFLTRDWVDEAGRAHRHSSTGNQPP